ncbi:MAG: NERD domain-containing protein [Actinobacteria bacterium]|nr:NERD domain-containing protein [Actinomycetota bacterium]
MAWPRLRGHRSGAARDGARSHGAAAADTPAAGGTRDELTLGRAPDDAPFWDLSAAGEADHQAGDTADGFGWEHVEDGYPADDRGSGAAPAETSEHKPVVRPVEEAAGPRPGIGQHRGNLAHLSANPRKRAWQQRAVIAVIVMVVFSVWISWRLGLTLAVIAVIADTIYRSRRGFTGKARLTGAQRRTRRQLSKLGRTGYRAMHGNVIPESRDQIDHLVIGPAGVFAIDSEAWDRRLIVRTKNARQLYHGPFSKKDRLEHARWESQRAADMLSDEIGRPVTVRPAMAVYGPKIPWDVATIREVDVFSGPRLRRYLRRRARLGDVRPLTDAEIEQIYRAANKAFPHLSSGLPAS